MPSMAWPSAWRNPVPCSITRRPMPRSSMLAPIQAGQGTGQLVQPGDGQGIAGPKQQGGRDPDGPVWRRPAMFEMDATAVEPGPQQGADLLAGALPVRRDPDIADQLVSEHPKKAQSMLISVANGRALTGREFTNPGPVLGAGGPGVKRPCRDRVGDQLAVTARDGVPPHAAEVALDAPGGKWPDDGRFACRTNYPPRAGGPRPGAPSGTETWVSSGVRAPATGSRCPATATPLPAAPAARHRETWSLEGAFGNGKSTIRERWAVKKP